jgi:hypothetical protein
VTTPYLIITYYNVILTIGFIVTNDELSRATKDKLLFTLLVFVYIVLIYLRFLAALAMIGFLSLILKIQSLTCKHYEDLTVSLETVEKDICKIHVSY